VQGHNSPLSKILLTKVSTLTPIWSSQSLSLAVWMVPWQCEGEENVADSDKREKRSEQIDGGEYGGGWGWLCEADGGWGEIEKTRREDEDERECSAEKSIMPLHFIGNY